MLPPAPSWTDRAFRLMGTDARVVIAGEPTLAQRAEELARRCERRWTRFRDDSELMRLNERPGRPVRVSRDTFDLIARAVDAWHRTDGRFDPTGLAALVAAGYDRDFAALTADAGPPADVRSRAVSDGAPLPGCHGIELDPTVGTVTLPAGVTLDLGGIGKGYCADLLADDLLGAGATGACIDLGGDIRLVGTGPYAGAWEVGFASPDATLHWGRLRFATGAVATSTTTRRRWMRAGVPAHHVIDPTTGVPARSGVATVTVLAAETWWAEVLAKSALIAGTTAGLALLEREGVDGLLVADDGSMHPTPGFGAWCTGGTHCSGAATLR